jgi:16S rRNA (cytidine1402-2'-O)-methyltransferase
VEIIPNRSVCVARELTKTFEEFRRGTPAELLAHFQKHPPKGEITLLIAPESKKRQAEPDEE